MYNLLDMLILQVVETPFCSVTWDVQFTNELVISQLMGLAYAAHIHTDVYMCLCVYIYVEAATYRVHANSNQRATSVYILNQKPQTDT